MKYLLSSYLICFCLNIFVNAVFYKSNTTDLTKCSESYSRTGSTYSKFYPLLIKENDSLILDFHFAVLATSDAHILLATTENVNKSDPAYEIVIGAGGNTFADIRRMQKSDVKFSTAIKGLLSALDPQFFWLHITKVGKAGLIEVGKEGTNTSFISWLDPERLPVKVISFSTWSGIEAKWYFNCDRSGHEEEIQKKLTTLEKLRRNLLTSYDPMVRPVTDPATITMVSIAITLEYLELDERKSTVNIKGSTIIRWHDEKLRWTPEKYGNISLLHVFNKEIWQPELLCYSAVGSPKDILQDSMLVVDNNGQVTWTPVLHVTSFCHSAQLGNWPRDTHPCKIRFGFLREYRRILINFNDSESTLLQHGSSQWLITEASIYDVKAVNSTMDVPAFVLYFEVKRSSTIYNTVFFTPFLVIAVCLLSSFWISPFGHTKVSMVGAQLLLESIMLLALAEFVPNNYDSVPFLVLLYSWSLVGSLVSLIISIMVINISRIKKQNSLSHIIRNLLTTKFIRNVLCLPNVVMPDEYGCLNASQSFSNLSKAEDKNQLLWILLGVAIDRLAFLIYTILIFYVNQLKLDLELVLAVDYEADATSIFAHSSGV